MQQAHDWAPWRNESNLSRKERVARSNHEGWKLFNEGAPGQMLKGSYFAALAFFGIWANLEPTSPLWIIVKSMAILALLSVIFVSLCFLRSWDERKERLESVSMRPGFPQTLKRYAARFANFAFILLGIVFVVVLAVPQFQKLAEQLVYLALK